MFTQVFPWNPSSGRFVRLRFPDLEGRLDRVYLRGHVDEKDESFVLTSLGERLPGAPLAVVIETSVDGTTWSAGGTDGWR